jgi:hypothetical protein
MWILTSNFQVGKGVSTGTLVKINPGSRGLSLGPGVRGAPKKSLDKPPEAGITFGSLGECLLLLRFSDEP